MSDNTAANRRIAKNTLFLYIRMVFVLLVTLYSSRVLLAELGVEDFGIYNVVAGFVSMFGFFNATLSTSMQRFYNFELGKNGNVSRVYVTGFFLHVAFALVLFLLLESIGVWYVNNVMVIPSNRLFAANILFQVSSLSLVFIVIQIPYVGAIMAYEHLDFYAIVSIVDVILKLVIVLALPLFSGDKLVTYSILFSIISIINFILYFSFAKRKCPGIVLKSKVSKPLLNSMLSFSGWNLVGTFAFTMKGQGLNLVLNYFFGPVINAARGIASQVGNAISSFSGSITTSFKPQLVQSYSMGDTLRSVRLMFLESRVCFMLMGILAAPVVINIDLILGIWLGSNNVPEYTSAFTTLTMVDCLISSLNAPCTHLTFASGKVKEFQIGSSIVHLALLPVALLCLMAGMNATSVYVITIIFAVINQFVCIILCNKVVGFGLNNYLHQVIIPCFVFILLLPLFPFLISLIIKHSITSFLVSTLAVVIIGCFLGWFVVLSNSERDKLLTIGIIAKIHSIFSRQ